MNGGGGSFGYPSAVYKVTDRADSYMYTLRRFDNVRSVSQAVLNKAMAKWKDVRHPSIVLMHEITFEKGAIFFTYAYHPSAQTLKRRFVDQRGTLLNESLIWRILVQLVSGIRYVHNRGFALRIVDPVHVLLTSGTCVRFNCVGIPDVLEFETRKSTQELMREDITKLGRLILSTISRTYITSKNTDEAVALMKQHFSPDLHRVVITLLSGKPNINQISQMMNDKLHDQLVRHYTHYTHDIHYTHYTHSPLCTHYTHYRTLC